MTQLRITLTIDDAEVNLDNYESPEGVRCETIKEAVELDSELYESGEINLDEFLHGYGGVTAVANIEVIEEDVDASL